MNVSITKQKPEFEPRTVALNFETQQQWDCFKWMCSCNLSVPETVFPKDYSRKKQLQDMLSDIHSAMRDELEYSLEFKGQ